MCFYRLKKKAFENSNNGQSKEAAKSVEVWGNSLLKANSTRFDTDDHLEAINCKSTKQTSSMKSSQNVLKKNIGATPIKSIPFSLKKVKLIDKNQNQSILTDKKNVNDCEVSKKASLDSISKFQVKICKPAFSKHNAYRSSCYSVPVINNSASFLNKPINSNLLEETAKRIFANCELPSVTQKNKSDVKIHKSHCDKDKLNVSFHDKTSTQNSVDKEKLNAVPLFKETIMDEKEFAALPKVQNSCNPTNNNHTDCNETIYDNFDTNSILENDLHVQHVADEKEDVCEVKSSAIKDRSCAQSTGRHCCCSSKVLTIISQTEM